MFPYPLQWGPPTFSAGHSFAMMSAVIVSMVEVSIFIPSFLLFCSLPTLITSLARQLSLGFASGSSSELYYIHLYSIFRVN